MSAGTYDITIDQGSYKRLLGDMRGHTRRHSQRHLISLSDFPLDFEAFF